MMTRMYWRVVRLAGLGLTGLLSPYGLAMPDRPPNTPFAEIAAAAVPPVKPLFSSLLATPKASPPTISDGHFTERAQWGKSVSLTYQFHDPDCDDASTSSNCGEEDLNQAQISWSIGEQTLNEFNGQRTVTLPSSWPSNWQAGDSLMLTVQVTAYSAGPSPHEAEPEPESVYVDDVRGGVLDPGRLEQARRDEVDWCRKIGVWTDSIAL